MTDTQPVIVGIDPGTTTAVAVLDHTGEHIAATSKKEFARSDITRYIIQHGKPVLVAVDVSPAPSTVEKIATAFGVTLWHPETDLSTEEKERLAGAYAGNISDDHIKDALAAARKAYMAYKDRINEAKAKTVSDSDEKATVTAMIDTAINDPSTLHQLTTESSSSSNDPTASTETETNWKKVAKRHIDRSKQKQKTIERLRSYLEELKLERNELQNEISALKEKQETSVQNSDLYTQTVKKIERLQSEQQSLQSTLQKRDEQLATIKQAVHSVVYGPAIMVPIISTVDAVPPAADTVAIDGSIENALPAHVTTVIVDDDVIADYRSNGYTVFRRSDTNGTTVGSVLVFFPNQQNPVSANNDFASWLDEYRDRHEQ